MQVAIELGDVYMLRFKIDFSGCSRGYAYLQYIDAQHKALALEMYANPNNLHKYIFYLIWYFAACSIASAWPVSRCRCANLAIERLWC